MTDQKEEKLGGMEGCNLAEGMKPLAAVEGRWSGLSLVWAHFVSVAIRGVNTFVLIRKRMKR